MNYETLRKLADKWRTKFYKNPNKNMYEQLQAADDIFRQIPEVLCDLHEHCDGTCSDT